MDFFGRYAIPASPEIVWAALNDPEILKACIPGCEVMTKTDDSHFETAVALKIGPVKATFKGRVTLENPDPPRSVRLIGEGQGGVAGFAKGHADIALSPDGHGTVLACTAKASLGGKLAQAGQKLIGGAAKQIADDFFVRFAGAIQAASAVGSAGAAGEVVLDSSMPSLEPPPVIPELSVAKREGVAPEIWVVGLIAVIVILLVLFGVSL
jgi:carbon monoxide dehydrogenase subunit G